MTRSSNHTVGKYRLLAELGRGGMSKVYVAVTTGPAGFSKLVVLKILEGNLAKEPDFVTMFLDEARLAARINHANVVQTNEVGSDGDRYFIAMEFLEGQPLQRVVKRATTASDGIPLALFLRVISKTLEGLHAAHTARDFSGSPLDVVHRDASPHNVFVTYDGQVKLVDFGIARANGRVSEKTRSGVLKGKVVYMPPEQVQGAAVDGRADVFAIGVALYDHLALKRLWDGRSEVEIVAKLLAHDYPRSPRDTMPDVPEALDAICRKALAPDPGDRYADARAMQRDIETFLASRGLASSDRDLGEYVTKLFQHDRTDIDVVIQTQLRKLADDPALRLSDSPLPVLGKVAATTGTSSRSTDTQLASGVSMMPPAQRKSRLLLVSAALIALVGIALAVLALRSRERASANRETPLEPLASAPAVLPAAVPLATSLPAAPALPPLLASGSPASAPSRVAVVRAPTVTAAAPLMPAKASGAPAATSVTNPSLEPAAPPSPRSTRPDLGY